MVQEKLIINIGPLSSFNSLNLYLGPQLSKLRNDYIRGKRTIPVWDLRNISPKSVRMSSLVAFLSISKTIRDFIGEPIEILSHWHPEFQGFLADTNFIKIANDFDLFNWKGMLGGYTTGKTNPNTKIFYFSDLPNFEQSQEQVIEWKDRKRQEIKHSMILRLTNIFDSKYLDKKWSNNLESVLTITGAELVVNSLLHGNDIAFVGVQRSRTGITTAICDSGVGFPKSMKKNHSWHSDTALLDHLTALLLSCLLSKNKIGLYRAIDDVIMTHGYVVISSFDSEIRWESQLWEKAKSLAEKKDLKNITVREIEDVSEGYLDFDKVTQGYFKNYSNYLVGTRITFEIPF